MDDLRSPISPRARPTRAASSTRFAVAMLAVVSFATACEKPNVEWIDDDPVATTAPSPLAHPPFVPIDSLLHEGTADANFLLSADLMREAGAASLLASHLDRTTESKASAVFDTAAANISSAGAAMAPTEMSGMNMPGMDMAGMNAMGGGHQHEALGDGDVPVDTARCARSLRIVNAPGRGRVAVWWSRRNASRVSLVSAWRDSSAAGGMGAWRGPITVDSLDQGPGDARAAERGAAGCSRPAPSIAVDDQVGYVHVAYVLRGPEGPGVFYAHQMDPRAAFESPQAIVYGDRLGAARVSAAGTVVAVAYEDPNSGDRTRVGLAISRLSGHLFEPRLIASGTTTIARDPYVAVRGRAVIVGWSELPGGEPVFKMRRALVR